MNTRDINNYFGDMDLFLMDLILKNKVPTKGRVLDVGCGSGRNGIYFIRNGYEYIGIDRDESQIRLLEYLAESIEEHSATFHATDLLSFKGEKPYDIIICSQVLHFAADEQVFYQMWDSMQSMLDTGGYLYASMDSEMDNLLGKSNDSGLTEFPDGKIRFSLNEHRYQRMKKGFEEIEPLRTLVQHKKRAQSFFYLKKA